MPATMSVVPPVRLEPSADAPGAYARHPEVVKQVHDPWLGHAIPSLRTAVLRGLPLPEQLERGGVRRVELEATRSLVSIESSTLSVDLFDCAPVTVDVCVVAEV